MITTIYQCDRCKNLKKPEELFKVNIHAHCLNTQPGYGLGMTPSCGETHWCRDCMTDTGYFKSAPIKGAAEAPKPPTIEDLIKELIESHNPRYS